MFTSEALRNHQKSEIKYIIPYQRNPKITGRSDVLEDLKELLETEVPKKYNHRVALYGMGGIGKTLWVEE